VFKAAGLLQKRRVREAALYQAARLFELLPSKPNELWQADVTYLHIPGHGWWYAVTVIDYYSRYLLACYFTASYSAREVAAALDAARAEAERLHGPLEKTPFLVTDNASSFLARQTLKTEEVYWNLYPSPAEARASLERFRTRYNEVRPHWALLPVTGGDPLTPADVYVQGQAVQLPKWQGWAKAAREKLKQMAEGAHLPLGAEASEAVS
jgi:transposase InsO family protein